MPNSDEFPPRSPTGRASEPTPVSAELARLSGLTSDFYGDEPKRGGMSPAVTFGKRKSVAKAYLLWVLTLGSTGQHRFYCGAPITAAMQVVLMLLTLPAFVKNPLGGVTLPDAPKTAAVAGSLVDSFPDALSKWAGIILLLWAGLDLFLIPRMVRKYNSDMFDDYKPPAPRYYRVHVINETAIRSATPPPPAAPRSKEVRDDDWMNRPPDRF